MIEIPLAIASEVIGDNIWDGTYKRWVKKKVAKFKHSRKVRALDKANKAKRLAFLKDKITKKGLGSLTPLQLQSYKRLK